MTRQQGEVPTTSTSTRIAYGDPGAYAEMIGWTMARSVFVAPGLAIAGIRGRKLLWGSLAASAGISIFAVALALFETRDDRRIARIKRRRRIAEAHGNSDFENRR